MEQTGEEKAIDFIKKLADCYDEEHWCHHDEWYNELSDMNDNHFEDAVELGMLIQDQHTAKDAVDFLNSIGEL
jgi:hypothetical protein